MSLAESEIFEKNLSQSVLHVIENDEKDTVKDMMLFLEQWDLKKIIRQYFDDTCEMYLLESVFQVFCFVKYSNSDKTHTN